MKKILVIDDETSLRETIAELLMVIGFTVFEAQNGEEGLKKVQEVEPNLVICDIMMPVMDGYEFMEAHMKSVFFNIPVLFLSAKVEKLDKQKGLNLGAKDYISKPFEFNNLKQTINYYLENEINIE
jgi:two-component system, chemotaxis family, chemotaxis protein CheY